jgi:hypothetical protein
MEGKGKGKGKGAPRGWGARPQQPRSLWQPRGQSRRSGGGGGGGGKGKGKGGSKGKGKGYGPTYGARGAATPSNGEVCGFSVTALAIAGLHSAVHVRHGKTLNVLFDIGTHVPSFATARHVFVSHGHTDHVGAIFAHARHASMACPSARATYWVPRCALAPLRAALAAFAQLDGESSEGEEEQEGEESSSRGGGGGGGGGGGMEGLRKMDLRVMDPGEFTELGARSPGWAVKVRLVMDPSSTRD